MVQIFQNPSDASFWIFWGLDLAGMAVSRRCVVLKRGMTRLTFHQLYNYERKIKGLRWRGRVNNAVARVEMLEYDKAQFRMWNRQGGSKSRDIRAR